MEKEIGPLMSDGHFYSALSIVSNHVKKLRKKVSLINDWCPYCKQDTVVERNGYLKYCTNCKTRVD